MVNCQGFSKETFFFGLFLENTNSVPLSLLRILRRIFLLKQIFFIMGYSAEIVGRVLQKYYRWLKIDHNRKISVSRKLLLQSPRKFQDIYYFCCSIEPHKNYENIFWCKFFRNSILTTSLPRPLSCKSYSSAKTGLTSIKISEYMQLD